MPPRSTAHASPPPLDALDLRSVLESELNRRMVAEVTAQIEASAAPRPARNGYRLRTWETRVGTVRLCVPKLRRGTYTPSFLPPRTRWEPAFSDVVAAAYVEGVSTRRMRTVVEAMGPGACPDPKCHVASRHAMRTSTSSWLAR